MAWVTSQIAQKSALPGQEQLFMDSHATAAVAIFESGRSIALKKWLDQTSKSKKMIFYLLTSTGEIIGSKAPSDFVKQISENLTRELLDNDLIKFNNIMVSHEILSTSGRMYRLLAVSEKPLVPFGAIPWTSLALRVLITILISGVICYFLSLYLTRPLRLLRQAAKSIGRGKLSTRVGHLKGHSHDEIAELNDEFDRMAEQLEILVDSKERLIQDISHELRSPLARLQIALELGRKKTGNLAELEFIRMEDECLRLGTLIQEVLEFARLKSPLVIHKKRIDMQQLIQQIIKDANFESGEDRSRVVLKDAQSCYLLGDVRLLHRAIENIIRNSLYYAAPDPQALVSLYFNKDHSKIYIDIQDNGPGVPENQLKQIFNPFYRVDSSRKKSTGGYGLGLSIVQRAIQLHDGEVSAINRQEGGLIVRITLPTS